MGLYFPGFPTYRQRLRDAVRAWWEWVGGSVVP